ncbi:MAG: hypothetical protein KA715_13345 [Xanthomonadaceae bacterium]|nr:hypothetical protein [Xanthomonadaceae bacterium]
MVTHLHDVLSRCFKTLHFKVQTYFGSRNLLPLIYLGLALVFGFAAHEGSEHSAILSWKKSNPPTLSMWSGELASLGWREMKTEKTKRALYRSFPYKNKSEGWVFHSTSLGCFAVTTSPEKEALPHFFCGDSDPDTKSKPDWKTLGLGWSGWDEAHLLKKPIQKLKISRDTLDPREIRY